MICSMGCSESKKGGTTNQMDAGPSDAGRADAPAPRPDAGPWDCNGDPPSCTALTLDTCDTVEGCVPTDCGGFTVPCDDLEQDECEGSTGCAWADFACSGTPAECSTLTGKACAAQPGCTTLREMRCGGLGVDCEAYTTETCATQPGCTEKRQYDSCERAEQCPAGSECRVVTNDLKAGAMQPVCRAPCKTPEDCPASFSMETGGSVPQCLDDGFCAELCDDTHECPVPRACFIVTGQKVGVCSQFAR